MTIARYSRHHRSRRQTEIGDRLRRILRTLIAIASGQHGGHRHGISASRGRSFERRKSPGRRAWLVKREISAWRLGGVACVVLLFIWISWQIVAQTAALGLSRSDPEAALGFVADQPLALDRLAQQELLNPDSNLDAAREGAEHALRSNPLSSRAFTLLGLIAERKGDQKGAETLMRIAGARTWRDRTTQAWLFDFETRRGHYADALPHLDAMLRAYFGSASRAEYFPILAALTAYPPAFKALTASLATSPPWREWFLSELSAHLSNQARLIELYSALNKTGNPPTKKELSPYLNRLTSDGNFEQAYQAWHETLPPEQRVRETYPFNRDFELPIDDLLFNWTVETAPGADIQTVSPDDSSRKRELLVQFSGSRVWFAVKQFMLLPPGNYTFTGGVKTEQLLTTRGLWWRIYCANGPTLANTELVSGTTPWTEFKVDFQVPGAGCEAQELRLELPARIGPEQQIEGRARYRNLRIIASQTAQSH
jgi:hypothetical protein